MDVAHSNLDFKMAGSKVFMTRQEFVEKIEIDKARDKILTWIELDEDVVYHITHIEERFSIKFNGPCWILHVMKEGETEICRVWGPRKLIEDIRTRRQSTERAFIMSLGQEYYKGKTFNKYDLAFKDSNQFIKLFDEEGKGKSQ